MHEKFDKIDARTMVTQRNLQKETAEKLLMFNKQVKILRSDFRI